ncbi:helix-turn-helix domain-containing protein [Streptomyces chartreusis]|uniref:helix-turn-helix domain-containing protein n=1 Tax=Streptomyces chartreusis TaxID=1969 RepID=UPI003676531F
MHLSSSMIGQDAMARGVAGFDGAALKSARLEAKCEEHSHALTAACLARSVGTSKALILSYENGRSSPSPVRLAQLAAAVGVPATDLLNSDVQLGDLRVARGLTMSEVASRLGVAVNTYRRIELDGALPKRRAGIIWDLAGVFHVDHNRLHSAFRRIPAVETRLRVATSLLSDVVARALKPGVFAPVEDTTAEAQGLAILFRSRPTVVSRLLNIHLSDLRQIASQRAQIQVRLDFSTASHRINQQYERELRNLQNEMDKAQRQGPELLEHYLTNPMSQQCWQTLVQLYTAGPMGMDPQQLEASTVTSLEKIFDYYLIERALTGVTLSAAGVLFFVDTLPYYRAIYPIQGAIRPDMQHYGWLPSSFPRASMLRRHLRTAHVLGHDPYFFWNDSRQANRR